MAILSTGVGKSQSTVIYDQTLAPAIGIPFEISGSGYALTDAFGRLELAGCRDSFRVATQLYDKQAFSCSRSIGDTLVIRSAELATATIVSSRVSPISGFTVGREFLERQPALLGEPDVFRGLQILPGVSSAAEGTVAPAIRGGSPDQTLVVLDEAVLYSPGHLMGYQSALPAAVVGDVSVHLGRFPASYGDRVSGVVEVRSRDGRRDRHYKQVGLGIPNASILLEGPVGKGSYLASARATYPSLITFASPVKIVLGDVFAKMSFPAGPRSRFEWSAFANRDNLRSIEESVTQTTTISLNWGNALTSARYVHEHRRGASTTAAATYSSYASGIATSLQISGAGVTPVAEYDDRRDGIAVWVRHAWRPTLGGRLNAYAQIRNEYTFRPTSGTTADPEAASPTAPQNLLSLSAHTSWRLSKGLSAEVAGRYVRRQSLGNFQTAAIEPRLALISRFGATRLTASYDRMTQPVHIITTGGADSYRTVVAPESRAYPATRSEQFALSLVRPIERLQAELQATAYYRKLDNIVRYIDGFGSTVRLEETNPLATLQDGRAYGLELFATILPARRSTTTLAYTLAWSQRRNVDEGYPDWQRYRYDRRHVAKLVHTEPLGERWSLDAQFTFQSGFAIRSPDYTIPATLFAPFGLQGIYGERYLRSAPPTHRLDLSCRRTVVKRGRRRDLILSVYNVYARSNPSAVYYNTIGDFDNMGRQTTYRPALRIDTWLRLVPGVMYRFEI